MTDLCTGPDRRQFIRLMAASFAMAGLSGCDDAPDGRAEEVPYVNNPLRIQPSARVDYASLSIQDGLANGIVVTTRNARPLKVEGNPDHPWSQGGTDVSMQAGVLDLYDPLRSQTVRKLNRPSSWQAFRAEMAGKVAELRAGQGEGLHIVTGPLTSPSFIAQLQAMLTELPKAIWYTHSPVGGAHRYAGTEAAFGRPLETRYRFDAAKVIVSLDGDFLDGGPDQTGEAAAWVAARRATAKAGPLLAMHAAASIPSLTAAKADHPVAASPAEMLALAQGFAGRSRARGDSRISAWGRRVAAGRLAGGRDIGAAAQSRDESGGGGAVCVAGAWPEAVHRVNAALGNAGQDRVLYRAGGEYRQAADGVGAGSPDRARRHAAHARRQPGL